MSVSSEIDLELLRSSGDEVIDHFLDQIWSAEIEMEPFPHFVVDEVLPSEFYVHILNALRGIEASMPHNGPLLNGQGAVGVDFEAVVEKFSDRTDAAPQLLRDLKRVMSAADVFAAFFAKFVPYVELSPTGLGLNLGARLHTDILMKQLSMECDMGVHTGFPDRVYTAFLFLSDSLDSAASTISLYAPKQESFSCIGMRRHKLEDFYEIRSIPMRPNSLVAILNSERSFVGLHRAPSRDRSPPMIEYASRLVVR